MRIRKSIDQPENDGWYHTDIGHVQFRDGMWRNKGFSGTVNFWVEGIEGNWFDAAIQKPEDNVGVMVFIPSEDDHMTAAMVEKGKWIILDDYRESDGVTHWMPLPPPPKTESE